MTPRKNSIGNSSMLESQEIITNNCFDRENNSYYALDEALLSTRSLTVPRKEGIYQINSHAESPTQWTDRSSNIHKEHQLEDSKTRSGYSHSLPRQARTADWISQHVGRKTAPVKVPHIDI